jgi:hypothetical protein
MRFQGVFQYTCFFFGAWVVVCLVLDPSLIDAKYPFFKISFSRQDRREKVKVF